MSWLGTINWNSEAVTAAATIALAFLTLILAFGTIFLWFATRRLVRGAEETAERQLRAYVNINGAKIFDPLDRVKRRAAVEIKNFGQTPAHDQVVWLCTVVRELPLKTELGAPPDSFQMGRESLPPGRTSVIELPIGPLNDWEENELRCGRAAIYLRGEIRYTDIFGKPRKTQCRLWCHGEGLPSGRVSAEAEGNEAT